MSRIVLNVEEMQTFKNLGLTTFQSLGLTPAEGGDKKIGDLELLAWVAVKRGVELPENVSSSPDAVAFAEKVKANRDQFNAN